MKKILLLSLFSCLLLTACVEHNSSNISYSNTESSNYSTDYFTVTWLDYDNTILEVDTNVKKGTFPSYDGVTPTRVNEDGISCKWVGWDKPLTIVTSDITYVAVYELPEKFQIYYRLDGGTNNPGNPTEYYQRQGTFTLLEPTKDGDLFDGWYTDYLFTEEITEIDFSSGNSITLYAKWCGLDSFTYTLDGDCIEITGVAEGKTVRDIDFTEIKKYKITSIADNAFSRNKDIREVKLPETLLNIGEEAFYMCSQLTDINIPDSVVSVGDKTFQGATRINFNIFGNAKYIGNDKNKFIYLKEAVNTGITTCEIHPDCKFLAAMAFSNCTKLTSEITLPTSIRRIPRMCFYGCKLMEGINFNEGVVSIDQEAFVECRGLKSLIFPSTLNSIGEFAFWWCENIEIVSIPISVKEIEQLAFKEVNSAIFYCESASKPSGWADNWKGSANVIWSSKNPGVYQGLKYYVSNLNNTEVIHIQQLIDTSLEEVVIPDSIEINNKRINVTHIDEGAFAKNETLKSISIPDTLVSIGELAFDRCINLESIVLPNSVTTIENRAFEGCTSLTDFILPNKLTEISFGLFSDCSNLENVDIPEGIKSIGDYAFSSCSSLKEIRLPNSLERVGLTAFDLDYQYYTSYGKGRYLGNETNPYMYLLNLDVIKPEEQMDYLPIHNKCKIIGSFALGGLWYVKYVRLPNSVTYICEEAFAYSLYLLGVTLPDNLKSIEANTFVNCESLSGVNIPDGVEKIEAGAFWGCKAIKSVNIPNSVESIGGVAFSGCKSLSQINIPNKYIKFGEDVFKNCESLSCTSFQNGKYLGCTENPYVYLYEITNKEQTSFVINNDCKIIGEKAFYNYSTLESIRLSNNIISINYNAFENCSGLTSIIIPNNVLYIESKAFLNCSSLVINVEASERPQGWSETWNPSECEVIWNYKPLDN